jgi:transcriptional regulator with XRE-family HTH domain
MVILSKFAENLSALMEEKNLNAPALANILHINRSNIRRYLRGERLPNYHLFINIIEYFNVSSDVLLGRVDYCDTTSFQPIQPFHILFRKALEETHTSQYELQKQLHFSSATTNAWLSNKSTPSIGHLAQLADYMELSVDYLLGRIS